MTDIDHQKLVHCFVSDIMLICVFTQDVPLHTMYIKVVLGFELL